MTKFLKTNTLIVVALEDELPRILVKNWRVIYTGIGKVNAVIETSLAVEEKGGFHHKFWYRWFFKRKHKRSS